MADNLFDQASQEFPILKDSGIGYSENIQDNPPYFLEFWKPGQKGDEGGYLNPRPESIPLDKPGVEVYNSKTRPIDIMGDVASHHLVDTDPQMKEYYNKFKDSMTEKQMGVLQDQYKYYKENNDEKRPFGEWAKDSGIPAYFRGYAFDQWPKETHDTHYTSEQRSMFDEMMSYLRKK